VSQQPYQPGQQGGYQQPGQPGYPQGGYQQPGAGAPQPGYGGYPGGSQYGGGPRPNPLNNAAGLGSILQIVGGVVVLLGIIAAIISLTLDGVSGSGKFLSFADSLIYSLGLGGLLVGLGAVLKSRPR
jgi:hypothetical protein